MERLSGISAEEREILAGEQVDMTLYTRAGGTVLEPGGLLPGGSLFGIRTHTRFAAFPRHSHTYVEMVYQVTGVTRHIINGAEKLELPAGSLLLLGRGAEHEIMPAGRGDVAVNFILVPAFFDNAAISMGGSSALAVFLKSNLGLTGSAGAYLVFDISGDIPVENLLENLVLLELEGADPRRQELQRATLELLLRHLSLRAEKLQITGRRDREQAAVLYALSRIEADVHCTLADLAREQGLTPSTLTRILKRRTGCTFTELLHTARFNRAVTLLTETELSVADIAVRVGYENTAFFYRRFERLYGCTPGEYRRRNARSPVVFPG